MSRGFERAIGVSLSDGNRVGGTQVLDERVRVRLRVGIGVRFRRGASGLRGITRRHRDQLRRISHRRFGVLHSSMRRVRGVGVGVWVRGAFTRGGSGRALRVVRLRGTGVSTRSSRVRGVFAAIRVHSDSRNRGGSGARLRSGLHDQFGFLRRASASRATRVACSCWKCGEEGVGAGIDVRRVRDFGARGGANDRAVRGGRGRAR